MEKSTHIVKRPNETIGIVPAGKHRITHLVRRLYSVILLFSQQQGEREEYSAVLSDMLAAANSSGSNRTEVKAILRDIRSIGVDWNVREGDRDIWKNVGLIEEPGLIDGKGTPTIVTWKLPALIRNRLLDPRGFFTRISLEMMTRLRSGASIALYEICCQYASNDHGKGEGGLTNRGRIPEWMPRLTGSRKADYEYKFLKRDVVMPAISEINEITDLRIELVEHKVGRRVDEIQFRVFRKSDGTDASPSTAATLISQTEVQVDNHRSDPMQSLSDRLAALGASSATSTRLLRRFAEDLPYLIRHVDYVEARVRNRAAPPLANKIAFLQKALDHGYADAPGPEKQRVTPIPLLTAATATESSAVDVQSDAAMVAQQAVALARAQVWDQFQHMTEEPARRAIVDEFLQQTSAMIKTFHKKNGIHNMVVRVALTDWLIQVKRMPSVALMSSELSDAPAIETSTANGEEAA